MERLIARAGLAVWPRLFHSLRLSRETELAGEYAIHIAAQWMGNTPAIAAKHYLVVRDEDYARATATTGGAVQKAVQNPVHASAGQDGAASRKYKENPE